MVPILAIMILKIILLCYNITTFSKTTWEKTKTEAYSEILSNRDLHNSIILQGDSPKMLTTISSFNNALISF